MIIVAAKTTGSKESDVFAMERGNEVNDLKAAGSSVDPEAYEIILRIESAVPGADINQLFGTFAGMYGVVDLFGEFFRIAGLAGVYYEIFQHVFLNSALHLGQVMIIFPLPLGMRIFCPQSGHL